jgi:EmrB/QacA subfamily drug resistance transporter
LSQELHTPLSSIQWVTTGYLLALALTLPMTGWAVDRFGTKRVYLLCFTAFTITSVLCGFAPSAGSLIFFRLLQGMAGGLLAPMAQMTIARAAGVHMARVMALIVMPVLIGPILGPALAGAILQHASWRWIFFINLPIGVVATALAALVLPADDAAESRRSFDFFGFSLLAPGLVLLLYGLESLESRHTSLPVTLCELAAAASLIFLFIAHCLRSKAATLVDVRLFGRRIFSTAAVTQFSTNAISFGGQLLLPLYLLTARGMSEGKTGLILGATGAGMLCTYPFIGVLTERLGARIVAGTGAFIALCGTLPFALLGNDGLPMTAILAALFVRGVGLSSINIPSMTTAYGSVPREVLPVATTAMNIVQRLGGPVGTALLAVFLHARLVVKPTGIAFSETFGLLCGLHAFSLVSSLQLPMGRVHEGAVPDRSHLPAVTVETE